MLARRVKSCGPYVAIYAAIEPPDFPVPQVYSSSLFFNLEVLVTNHGFLGEDEDHPTTPRLDEPETELINIVSLTVSDACTHGFFWLLPGQDTTGLISKAD